MGLLAGVYAAATIAIGSPSYLPVNLRFSNILLGVVPIIGWPSVFGLTLGVFLSNTVSSLGPLDLVSTVFSFAGLVAIQALRKKSALAGFVIYSLLLSTWVSFEIHVVFSAPYLPNLYLVFTGITIIVVGLAYPLYRVLAVSSLAKRFAQYNE